MQNQASKMSPEQVFESYGENFKGNFNPHTRNIRTGKISAQKHHCKKCEAVPSKRCYLSFHLVFCLELIPESKAKDAPMVICGERFALCSPQGCYTHPFNHGCNEALKNLKVGKDNDDGEEEQLETVEEEPEEFVPMTPEEHRISMKMRRETRKVEAAASRAWKNKNKKKGPGGKTCSDSEA